ncbi:type VI secretion system contractile sheath small subunit [Roseibium suaedae]|uniref:Type VI secretion protein, EvpB/VC_A0108 family/type VI secretion protein, VC_A0107 family n=2 Tax=Roseibium suaedae TaxID=735517 RepID=A0A1M7P984_9HYPH|nr:type VI secretion system contractile sheath small subunit [Roseibium suaedae]SHN13253.1 type VI secretion protein, EvpB/VC_A0108 family/type VI secretion protein, VC_A0107 family [Roseibium suaedae]
MSNSGQKFVARNRAPRVQIEYDVELYGAEKTVQLPFVMGVLADLSGKPSEELAPVSDRKFLEIDIDNFDERMKSMKPRAAFTVNNTLTGEGSLAVDITFESLEDFTPAALAKKVEPLAKLLEARTRLAHLTTYMDGKTGAENLIAQLISDPAALAALSAAPAASSSTADQQAALAGLRAAHEAANKTASAPALEETTSSVLASLKARPVAEAADDGVETTQALAGLRTLSESLPDTGLEDTNTAEVLQGLKLSAPEEVPASGQDGDLNLAALLRIKDENDLGRLEAEEGPDLAAMLAGLETGASDDDDSDAGDDGDDELAALLDGDMSGLEDLLNGGSEAEDEVSEEDEDGTAFDFESLDAQDEDADLAALLAAVAEDTDASEEETSDETPEEAEDEDEADTDLDFDLAALMAEDDGDTSNDSDDLAALLASVSEETLEQTEEDLSEDVSEDADAEADADFDAELAALMADDEGDALSSLLDGGDEAPDAALDASGEDSVELSADDELAALLAEDDNEDAALAALLSGDDTADETLGLDAEETPAPADPFGMLSAPQPEDHGQPRKKFRIALLGDFSGRASRGDMETGDGLAGRKPIKFDVDTIDAVIARFATTLVLPIGADGAGVEVPLSSLDDLHPDELYENVGLFEELAGLRQRVSRGEASALAEVKAWAAEAGVLPVSRLRSKGSAVPADRKLSDFQSLIGDMQGKLATASPAEDLIGRIVGPHVVAAASQEQAGLTAALDEALSGAMRTILHHPDFQAVESTWRSLEFLARRIETDATLEIVLYDVSAEEWAADLAAHDDLADSGLFRLLAEAPRLDEAQGPLSAVFGLYMLEETPPHAELMARMAKISAWMNAPFVTSISAQFLDTPKKDRHPLTAKAWDRLRAAPEAAFAGLASPRFLLRQPYGEKTEPVDPFDFEEFSLRSGVKGMLWANPVILSATLLAASVKRSGKAMRLGEIMSLGDIPVHIMTDQYGDQIALPCTERLLNTRTMADVVSRGFMPVLSIKGRNEVRQGSFQALGAGELNGPWELSPGMGTAVSGTSIAFSSALGKDKADAEESAGEDAAAAEGAADDTDATFDLGALSGGDDASGDGDLNLDDLLSGFGEDTSSADGGDDLDMDPELAALLGDL